MKLRHNILIYLSLLVFSLKSQVVTKSSGPNLLNARVGHAAQVLNSGKIYVFGGDDGYWLSPIYFKSTEFYDPVSNIWSYGPEMNLARTNHLSVLLNDGRILVVGGKNNELIYLYRSEIYSPENNSWVLADSTNDVHVEGSLVKLKDGRVLLAGGNTKTVEIFDPENQQWNKTTEMNLIHGEGMSLTLLSDGRVLAIGGSGAMTSAEIYNPINSSWTTISKNTLRNRKNHSALLLTSSKILIAGSSNFATADQIDTEIYDLSNNTFTLSGALKINCSDNQMILLDNGNALIYGIGDMFNGLNSKAIQTFKPGTTNSNGAWTAEPNIEIGASGYSMLKLHDGRVFIIGGIWTTGNGASAATLFIDVKEYSTCVPPNLDLSLSDINTCYGKDTKLDFYGVGDALYSLYLGSNLVGSYRFGSMTQGNASINIGSSNLTIGKNELLLRVQKAGCPSMVAKYHPVVNATLDNNNKPTISLTSGSLILCPNTSSVLTASAPNLNNFIWYNNSSASSININTASVVYVQSKDANGCLSVKSDFLTITKVVQSDVSAGIDQTLCESTPAFQLADFKPVNIGSWSGTGVNSTGFFTPISGTTTYTLTYSYCGLSDSKIVKIEKFNTVSMDQSMLNWGNTNDSVCGDLPQKITISDSNKSYKLSKDNVNVSLTYSSGIYSYSYTPTNVDSVNFKLLIKNNPYSNTCPADSLILVKKIRVINRPKIVPYISTDTACYGGVLIVKIPNPEKNVYYNLNINTTIGKTTKSIDGSSIELRTPYNFNNAYDGSIFAQNLLQCSNKTLVGKIPTKVFHLNTSFDINEAVYINTPVFVNNTSNASTYEWEVDGVKSYSKNPPTISYSSVGIHTYTLQADSKYGCADTLTKSIQIFNKAPEFPNNLCFIDTINTKLKYGYSVYKTHIDSKGNIFAVGSNFTDKAGGNYSGSFNWFIEKYDSKGKQLWKNEQDVLNYYSWADYYSSFVNGIDTDEEGNVYLTGNYAAKTFTIGGFSVTHQSQYIYNHIFIMKLDPNGKLVWFIYSEDPTNSDMGRSERGGSDIKYINGRIYVSLYLAENLKSNTGETYTVKHYYDNSIIKLSKEGKILQEFPMNSDYYTQNNIGGPNGVYPFYNPDNAVYNPKKIAVTSPIIQDLKNGRIAIIGFITADTEIGPFTLKPLLQPNQLSYSQNAFTEFSATLDTISGWVSAEIHGAPKMSKLLNPKKIPMAFFDKEGNYYSAASTGLLPNKSIGETWMTTYYFSQTDSASVKGANISVVYSKRNGILNWKKVLKNVTLQSMNYIEASDLILLYGTYIKALSFIYSDENLGLETSGLNDNFVMLLDAKTGKIVWAEKIYSSNEDLTVSSYLNSCNDFLLIGKQSTIYDNSQYPTTNFKNSKLSYGKDKNYMIRIPIVDLYCSATSTCTLLVSDENLEDQENEIQLFPNPTGGILNVFSLISDEINLINVRDFNGRLVLEEKYNFQQIDLAELNAGVYMFEIHTLTKTFTKKVVVLK